MVAPFARNSAAATSRTTSLTPTSSDARVGRSAASLGSCRSMTSRGSNARGVDVGGGTVQIRSFGLTLVAGAALLLSACTSTGGSPAASVAPDPCAGAKAGAAHTPPTDWTKAKIGVVTDIGTLNDKNFNEYSFKGAQDGATAIKAAAPQSVV